MNRAPLGEPGAMSPQNQGLWMEPQPS